MSVGAGLDIRRKSNTETGKASMDKSEYFKALARGLTDDLTPNVRIKEFVDNTDVIGAYAEAAIRRFVARVVSPLRVSTGAVIGPKICVDPKSATQVDTIVWSPSPFPAVFECGSFALIPRMSSLGLLEVKRSNYNNRIGNKIKKVLDQAPNLTSNVQVDIDGKAIPLALGVVCIRDYSIQDTVLADLEGSGQVVVLLEAREGFYQPAVRGTFTLVNFLVPLRLRSKHMDGQTSLKTDADVFGA